MRVHDDLRAATSARTVSARAYTVGNHIALADGVSLASEAGRRLLAHELVHVMQQAGVTVSQLAGDDAPFMTSGPSGALASAVNKITECRGEAASPEQCGCHDNEQYQYKASLHPASAAGRGVTVLQRHSGFRSKPVLQTKTLDTPELQTVASEASLALEVGKSSGDPVARLQRGLTAAGFTVPVTSSFDAATQRVVAAFQAMHGIPYPTGRQAGPKTLSTLDDHLLGLAAPTPTDWKAVPPVPPKTQPTRRRGCLAAVSTRMDAALAAASPDLNAAASMLDQRPLSQLARDALFVYFRSDDVQVAEAVAAKLSTAAQGLGSGPVIDCAALIGCGGAVHAVTNLISREIHICNDGVLDPDEVSMERTLIHESMHLFGGLGALGELSHGDAPTCDEDDLAGQSTGRRLANADSYAALAIRLEKAAAGLHTSAEHFRGADLVLVTQPNKTSTTKLSGAADSFTVQIESVSDLGPEMQWRLTDAEGRHYLLLDGQNEVIDPTTATASTLVKLGRRTRDLLGTRGVTSAVLSVHVFNRLTGLDRTVRLTLSFVP